MIHKTAYASLAPYIARNGAVIRHVDTLLDDVPKASATDGSAGLAAEAASAPERKKNV